MLRKQLPLLLALPVLFANILFSAPVSLDFVDDFEDRVGLLVDFPNDWTVDGDGVAEITSGSGTAASAGLELQTLSGQTLGVQQDIDAGYEPVVWNALDAKLVPHPDSGAAPTPPTGATVVFHLTQSGAVKVLNGSTWQTITLGLDTASSHHYVFKQDFAAQTWNLWVDGTLAAQNLAFANFRSYAKYMRLQQDGAGTSVVDNISIARSAPAGLEDGVGTYSDWAAGITWGSADDSPNVDPNGNGVDNFGEYAHALPDPVNTAAPYSTGITYDGDTAYAYLTYRRNPDADDVAYIVQQRSAMDAGDWEDVKPDIGDVTVTPQTGYDEVTVRVPMTGEALFLRLYTYSL